MPLLLFLFVDLREINMYFHNLYQLFSQYFVFFGTDSLYSHNFHPRGTFMLRNSRKWRDGCTFARRKIAKRNVNCSCVSVELPVRAILGTRALLNRCTVRFLWKQRVNQFSFSRRYSAICGFACLSIAPAILLPESPLYYLSRDDELSAEKSLRWYRGDTYDVQHEISETKRLVLAARSTKVRTIDVTQRLPLPESITFLEECTNWRLFCSFLLFCYL